MAGRWQHLPVRGAVRGVSLTCRGHSRESRAYQTARRCTACGAHERHLLCPNRARIVRVVGEDELRGGRQRASAKSRGPVIDRRPTPTSSSARSRELGVHVESCSAMSATASTSESRRFNMEAAPASPRKAPTLRRAGWPTGNISLSIFIASTASLRGYFDSFVPLAFGVTGSSGSCSIDAFYTLKICVL